MRQREWENLTEKTIAHIRHHRNVKKTSLLKNLKEKLLRILTFYIKRRGMIYLLLHLGVGPYHLASS